MTLEYFLRQFRYYASDNTLLDSAICLEKAKYKFIGAWAAIPTGTECSFGGDHMIDYIGNKNVAAFNINYEDRERFVSFKNLEYLPDIDAKRYIILRILKKEP